MYNQDLASNMLFHRKSFIALSIGALFILSPTLAIAQPVQQSSLAPSSEVKNITPNDNFSLKYNLTRTGLNLMKLKFNISLKGDQYRASHSLKSKGLIKIFADTNSKASVEGKIKKGFLSPTSFQISAEKKDKTKTAKLSWEGEKFTQELSPKLSDDRAKKLAPLLKPDLKDPLSGLLSVVMFDNPEKPCGKTIRVFEGRKIFELSYTYLETGKLQKSDPGSFRGDTHICQVKHTPIAGYSDKKMKKLLEANLSHKIWVARIKSPKGKQSYFVPVKMQLGTKYGVIDVELDKGKINGKKLRKAAISLP